MEASLLLFVIMKVYVERERDNRRHVKVQDPPVLEVRVGSNFIRARNLTYFCYDIHISIMISMLVAVRDLRLIFPKK